MTVRGRPATRRGEVLDYVKRYLRANGRAPSYNLICTETGIACRSNVRRIVADLETRGLLRRAGAGRVRRIQLT